MTKLVAKKKLKEFGFLIAFAFPILIGWVLPVISGHNFKYWTLWVGIFSFLTTIINTNLLIYPYRCWMNLGHVLGWINSKIILGLIFIFVLLPISLLMKLKGYDPLKLRLSKTKTYRECKSNDKVNLNRIF